MTIDTYGCIECDYVQDFKSDICPSCGGNLSLEKDPGKMTTVIFASDEEIEARKEDVIGADGVRQVEVTGYVDEVIAVDGKATAVKYPLYSPVEKPISEVLKQEAKDYREILKRNIN